MRKTFEVVDDFYRDPMLYRERALKGSSLAQRAERSGIYSAPGMDDALDDDEAARRIFQILGWSPDDAPRVTVSGYFTFGPEDAREPPATQLENFSWAGLVCLSLPESRPRGIGFYRREQTPPRDPAAGAMSGGPARPSAGRSHADGNATASGLDGTFRLTMDIPMRFNRLVLFQTSALGYGVSPGFEKTSEPGPLVQLLGCSEKTALTR
jgi:hypothetical protein